MRPFKPKGANVVFGAPEGREDNVMPLPVIDTGKELYSFWQPDEKEIAALKVGGIIRLCVVGRDHPVVALDVTLYTAEELKEE